MKISVILRTAVIALTLAGMAAITPVSPQAASHRAGGATAGIWYVAPGGNDDQRLCVCGNPLRDHRRCARTSPLFAAGDTDPCRNRHVHPATAYQFYRDRLVGR